MRWNEWVSINHLTNVQTLVTLQQRLTWPQLLPWKINYSLDDKYLEKINNNVFRLYLNVVYFMQVLIEYVHSVPCCYRIFIILPMLNSTQYAISKTKTNDSHFQLNTNDKERHQACLGWDAVTHSIDIIINPHLQSPRLNPGTADGERGEATPSRGSAKRHYALIPEKSLEKCLMYISDCFNPRRPYTRWTFPSSESFTCDRSDHRRAQRRESGPQHMMTRRHHPGPPRRRRL